MYITKSLVQYFPRLALLNFIFNFITRAVGHRVEVSAPVLFLGFFLVHVVLKYASLNHMRLRPGYISFELSNMAAGQRCFE